MERIKEYEEGGLWIIKDHQQNVRQLQHSTKIHAILHEICERFQIDAHSIKYLTYGGQGILYVGISSKFGTTVSIKLPFYNQYEFDSSKEAALLKEAQILSRMPVSPKGFLPQLLAYDPNGRFLIKKFYDYAHLSDIISQKPFDPNSISYQLIEQFSWIRNALNKSFREIIVLSDFKISNLLYDVNSGTPMLIDLGNSKKISEIFPDKAATYRKIGSGHFLHWPPELLLGNNQFCGDFCNDFILGVLLYFVVFHRFPYNNSEYLMSEQFYKKYEKEYQLASKKLISAYEQKIISKGLCNFIIKIINPNYSERYTCLERRY